MLEYTGLRLYNSLNVFIFSLWAMSERHSSQKCLLGENTTEKLIFWGFRKLNIHNFHSLFDLFSINKTPPSIHKKHLHHHHHHHHRHQVSTSCLKQQFFSVEQVGEFPPRLESGADASTTNTVQALTRQREVDSVCVCGRLDKWSA